MTVLGAALNNEVVPGSCQGAMHPGADECWTAEMKPCVSTASMTSFVSTRAGSFDSSSAGGRYASESHSVPSSESFSDELSDSSSSSRLSDVAFKARRGAKERCPPLHRGSSPAESQCALKASATHSERSFVVRSMARQPCLRFGLPPYLFAPEEHDGAGEPAFEVRPGAKERCSPPSMSHAEGRAASKSSSGSSASSSGASELAFKARRGAKERCPPLHRGSSPAESQCALKASATHSERSFLVRSMARQPCLRFGLPLQASRWRRRARVAPSPEEHDGAGEPAFEVRLGAKERCSPPSMSHAERRAASKSSSGSSASSSGASELAFQVRKCAKDRCSVETDCRSFVADSSYGGDIEIESLGSSGAEFQQRSISRIWHKVLLQEDDSDEEAVRQWQHHAFLAVAGEYR